MIREGKAAGWLKLPSEAFLPWAELNDVVFEHVLPGAAVGKGGALLAKDDVKHEDQADGLLSMMTVPRHLILSLDRILEHAKVDENYREVLESLGELGRRNWYGHEVYCFVSTPRGAILSFLLLQASISCPDLSERVGVRGPFTEYVKSLPCELLPTFWSEEELQLLVGTTLAPAISSKLRSLHTEYDTLCDRAGGTRWYGIVQPHLSFDDWLQVDAMYRSRALDFPQIGHCMVPCIDLANHEPGENTVAIYEKDRDGNAILQLRPGKTLAAGDEVTITYGDEKGACEMLFSYGFLEATRTSAETLFLGLTIPADDAYRAIKTRVADCAPGVKIIDAGDGDTDWTGDFIWLLVVGADDGLRFELARTVDGEGEEMQAFFEDVELAGGAAQLYSVLGKLQLWPVYRLRAITVLQQRVFAQLQILHGTQEDAEAVKHGHSSSMRTTCYEQAMQLRTLESELLERAYGSFEEQILELAETEIVKSYLARMNAPDRPGDGSTGAGPSQNQGQDEDFS